MKTIVICLGTGFMATIALAYYDMYGPQAGAFISAVIGVPIAASIFAVLNHTSENKANG